MELRFEPVTFHGEAREQVKKIYVNSFPKEERIPYEMMLLMAKLPTTELLAVYDGEDICGFVYQALGWGGKIAFLMHFAVAEELRSRGYGSKILDLLAARHPGRKQIVSIEPCGSDYANTAQRQRRKEFYLRNGYQDTGYRMKLAGQEQEVLIRNGEFHPGELFRFFLGYSNCTMWVKIWRREGPAQP